MSHDFGMHSLSGTLLGGVLESRLNQGHRLGRNTLKLENSVLNGVLENAGGSA